MQKILVIDNENLVADICRIALGKLGYEVFCANEDQAVQIAREKKIDIVVVHAPLAEMTEVNAYLKIRQVNVTAPGILVTEHPGPDMVFDLMRKGFSGICKKPVDTKQLVATVQEALKVSSLREESAQMKVLNRLHYSGEKFISAKSEQAIYEHLVDAVSLQTGISFVSVMISDDAETSSKVVAYRGLDSCQMKDLRIPAEEQIIDSLLKTRMPVFFNKENLHLNPHRFLMSNRELSATVLFPILAQDTLFGVLNVSSSQSNSRLSEGDTAMVSIMAKQAAMAVSNLRSTKEREESCRIRTLLEQYVSQEVSSMLLLKSNQDLLDVGRVKQLTVLFADIRNFTLLVQHLELSQLRKFLNSFFDMFTGIILSERGMLDKFMGDAALVVFDNTEKLDDPNVAAVSAAQEIMVGFEKLRQLWEKKNKIFKNIGLGIGISRGSMFLGNVGSSKRLDYTVIGPDVNIAQRLASETESGQILITDRVCSILSEAFPVKAEKSLLLRGMESQIIVYSLSVTAGQ